MKSPTRRYDMTARAAKAAATRERIRAAAIALYCERPIEDFILDEVARRAGTTVQTVLRAFGSKEALIVAALRAMAAAGVPLKPTPPGAVAPAVSAVVDLYEAIGDALVQRLGDEQRRPALRPALDEGRRNHADWVRGVFAPQLARVGGAAGARLLAALSVATDVYVWKLLRRDQGLERMAAEAVIRHLVEGALLAEDAHGTDAVAELVGRRESSA